MLPKITGIVTLYGFSRSRFFPFFACIFEIAKGNFIGFGMFTARTVMLFVIIMDFLPFGTCH
jgi:hypothetical protein